MKLMVAISLSQRCLEKLLLVWFTGMWLLILPQPDESFLLLKQYVQLCVEFLNHFVAKPYHPDVFNSCHTKNELLETLLEIQKQWICPTDMLDSYKRALCSERVTFTEEPFLPFDSSVYDGSHDIVRAVSPDIWGPFIWLQLFLVTYCHFVEHPDEHQFIVTVFTLLTCSECKSESLAFWDSNEKSHTFHLMMRLHNQIRTKKGKPLQTPARVIAFLRGILFDSKRKLFLKFHVNRQLIYLQERLRNIMQHKKRF